MRKLFKHDLDFRSSLMFFKESLEGTNSLSVEIIKYIEENKGVFFTLLPEEANITKLHEFSQSILPEQPSQRGSIGNLQGEYTYSMVISLEKEVCDYIINEIDKHRFLCVVDSFNETYDPQHSCDLFDGFGGFFKNEVYYILKPEKISREDLLECLYRSKTFWHSLCILTKDGLRNLPERNIKKEEIEEICNEARCVMIGAYAGDGYIFWEKKD